MEKPLTPREEMVKIINSGASTIWRGNHITTLSEIPSDVELAKGDAVETKATQDRLNESIAYAKAQLEQLQATKAEVEAQAKAESKVEPEDAPESQQLGPKDKPEQFKVSAKK